MGAVKRMAEAVAERLEIDDISDPRVLAEVERQLSVNHRRLVVIESHPNSGGFWTGKVGTEREVFEYLKAAEKSGQLDYVLTILELKEKAEHETSDWLKFEEYAPVAVRRVVIGKSPEGTPPLPGLEKRLAGIEAQAYGQKRTVWAMLQAMTDEEIAETFSDLLETLLQAGIEMPTLPKVRLLPDDTPCKCHRCDWQGTLGELTPTYLPSPKELGDVIPVPSCPRCSSEEIETP